MSDNKINYQTGDILLYHGRKGNSIIDSIKYYIQYLIEWFTGSEWCHVAMILKDPIYIDTSLKGLYIIESGYEDSVDAEDHKHKLGVQIYPLDEALEQYVGDIYYRKLTFLPHNKVSLQSPFGSLSTDDRDDIFSPKKMKEIHSVIHDKPYDLHLLDWFEAYEQVDFSPQKTSRFWCSALVSYIYTKVGLFNANTDWSIALPKEFGSNKINKLLKNAQLSEKLIKVN